MFIRSILLPLLLTVSTPVLTAPQDGVWYRGTYYEGESEPSLCDAIADELLQAVDDNVISEEDAIDVIQNCLDWSAYQWRQS